MTCRFYIFTNFFYELTTIIKADKNIISKLSWMINELMYAVASFVKKPYPCFM